MYFCMEFCCHFKAFLGFCGQKNIFQNPKWVLLFWVKCAILIIQEMAISKCAMLFSGPRPDCLGGLAMPKEKPEGIFIPMVTPFKASDESVDFSGLR